MPATPLCIADDTTFWPWHRWPEFHRWPERERTLVVVPLAGSADWGLGHPLDAEETVLMGVLRETSLRRPAGLRLLVVLKNSVKATKKFASKRNMFFS